MSNYIPKQDPFVRRYPFTELEVGEQWEIPKQIPRSSVSASASRWGKKRGRKFGIVKIDNGLFALRRLV